MAYTYEETKARLPDHPHVNAVVFAKSDVSAHLERFREEGHSVEELGVGAVIISCKPRKLGAGLDTDANVENPDSVRNAEEHPSAT